MAFGPSACCLYLLCILHAEVTSTVSSVEEPRATAEERRASWHALPPPPPLLRADTLLTLGASGSGVPADSELFPLGEVARYDAIVTKAVGVATPLPLELGAGTTWQGLSLSGSWDIPPPTDPQVRFVNASAVSTSSCTREDLRLRGDSIGGPEFAEHTSLAFNVSIDGNWTALNEAPLEFLKGGVYRLCYSDDGTFSAPKHAQLLNTTFSVAGVSDSCDTTNCLAEQAGLCHQPQEGEPHHESVCSLRYGGLFGENLHMTWSSRFSATYNPTTGKALSVETFECGNSTHDPDIFNSGNTTALETVQSSFHLDGKLHLDFQIPSSSEYSVATVAVCYCPAFANDTCSEVAQFKQQVGMLFIYTAALCDPSEGDSCTSRYEAVAAGQPFFLRIFCPPLGCREGNSSRIKLVAHHSNNHLPHWHASNGCRTAAHLKSWLPRGNCVSASNCSLPGGERQDYRTWGTAARWWAWETNIEPGAERPDLDSRQNLDMCYCDVDCDSVSGAWFNVGMMQVLPLSLAPLSNSSFEQEAGILTNSSILSVAGVKGMIGFNTPSASTPVLGLKTGGVVKLISDPYVSATAADCEAVDYANNPLPVTGLDSWAAASSRFGASNSHNQIVFDGGRASLSVSVLRAGTVAVCYCSSPGSSGECSAGSFFVAGRLTIRGPTHGQSWVVSIGGLFNLDYSGHGLEAIDTLRLSEHSCTADPISYPLTAETTNNLPDISTWVLSDSTVGCDELGQNCASRPIMSLNLSDSTVECDELGRNCKSIPGTQLDFSSDPMLAEGDEIVIGHAALNSTAGQLDALRGRFTLEGGYRHDLKAAPEAFRIDSCELQDSYAPPGETATTGSKGVHMIKVNNASYFLAQGTDGAWIKLLCPDAVTAWGFRVKVPKSLWRYDGMAFKDFEMQYSQDGNSWTVALSGQGAEVHGGHFQTFTWNTTVTARYWKLFMPGSVNRERRQFAIKYIELLVAATPAYIVPHRILPGDNLHKRRIRLAFGTSNDAVPHFDIDGAGVSWVRQNRAITKRDLLDFSSETTQIPPLHVCWKSGSATSYTMEVGQVRFELPPPMPRALVSLVAPIIGEAVPAILAFETGHAAYPSAMHGTALVLRFLNTAKVEPRTTSGESPGVGISNAHARQRGCGDIILEVWSSQTDLGFPLPRSCRFAPPYKAKGGRVVQEVEIQFEPYNGLKENTQYQVALNLRLSSSARVGEEVVQIVSTSGMHRVRDGVFLQPNQAVESGRGILLLAGGGQLSTSSDSLAEVELVGGQAHPTFSEFVELVQLDTLDRSGFDVMLRLNASSSAGVVPGSHLRVVFWPLMQWDLGGGISAECVNYRDGSLVTTTTSTTTTSTTTTTTTSDLVTENSSDLENATFDSVNASNSSDGDMENSDSSRRLNAEESKEPEYSCKPQAHSDALEKVIRSQLNNSIVVTNLSVSLDDVISKIEGTTMPVLRLRGHGGATGGFFSARPALVVSNPSYTSHQYLHPTSGTFLHKQGPSFGMIVTSRGDANVNPFPGDTNSLWVRMIFISSVPSGSIVKIEPRKAYPAAGCGPVGALPEDTRLNVSEPQYGTGVLRAGVWSTQFIPEDNDTDASCHWEFAVEADSTYASSSIFFQVTLRNPSQNLNFSNTDVWRATVTAPDVNLSMSAPFTVAPRLHTLEYENQTTVVSVLPFFQIVPDRFERNLKHTLWVFFVPANTIYPSGYVEVNAPHGYDFGNPCAVIELDREYYRYGGAGPAAVLERLPRVLDCTGKFWPMGSTNRTQALIEFGRPLFQGNRFGFGLTVTNPYSFRQSDQAYWSLVTRNVSGFPVDRSRGCISFTGEPDRNCSESWGLYDKMFLPKPKIRFGEMIPYRYTRTTSYVTLFPFHFPKEIRVPVRVTAPLGHKWEATTSYWQAKPPGATAYWPYWSHIVGDCQLLWSDPVHFQVGFKYGFRNPIHIPEWPMTRNSFIVEFGFQDVPLQDNTEVERPFVLVLPGSNAIRVVRGAVVDYLTGRAAQLQTVRISLTTISALYPGEGFVFTGFRARDTHEELRCQCPPAEFLEGLDCAISIDKITREVVMRLQAVLTILGGYKEFPFPCQNSVNLVPTSDWTIGTYQQIENYPNVVPVDGYAEVSGFGIQPPMRSFALLPARLAAGVDFRPNRPCGTILTFRLLTREWNEPSFARLRAPEGTIFSPDCLDEVITDPAHVFGLGVPFDMNYTWVPPVHLCRGVWHVIDMTWEQALIHGARYAFRVVALNPSIDAAENVWTLEVDGESSMPISANHVNTFTNTSVLYVSNALRFPGSEIGGKRSNRARIIFVPSVPAQKISLWAPSGYYFGNSSGCAGLRLSRMHVSLPIVLVPRLSGCVRDYSQLDIAFLSPDYDMIPNTEYTIEVDILNPEPTEVNISASYYFRLQAYWTAALGELGDETFIPAPKLADAPKNFSVTNVGDIVASFETVSVQISAEFLTDIEHYQRIMLTFPPLYMFEGGRWACPVKWLSPTVGPGASCYCDALPTCYVTIYATNTSQTDGFKVPWAAGRTVAMEVKIVNPGAILTVYENMWTMKLYPSITDRVRKGVIAVGTYRGWRVVPPLSHVMIGFGSNAIRRAGASGAVLALAFTPPSEASHLRLTALSPSGWSFVGTEVCIRGYPICLQPSNETLPTVLDLYGVTIQPGRDFYADIHNVKNADVSGQAAFTLETFIQDQDNKWFPADSSGRLNSFILPGATEAWDVLLRTGQYLVSDPTDSFWAKLPPRLNTQEGVIQFYFSVSEFVNTWDWMQLSPMDDTYDLTPESFYLVSVEEDIIDNEWIPVKTELVNPTVLKVYSELGLAPAPKVYQARVVIRPLKAMAGSSTGAFLNISFCRYDRELPLTTNDGLSQMPLTIENWTTSEVLAPFTLLSTGVSPTSESFVTGSMPNNLNGNGLVLVAPAGLKFIEPCQPSPCDAIVEGFGGTDRPAAVGLNGTNGQFSLRVVLPTWWVKGRRDWSMLLPGPSDGVVRTPRWGSAPGFNMYVMPGSVSYAAMPLMQDVYLTVSFMPGSAAGQIIPEGSNCNVLFRVPDTYGVSCANMFQAVTVDAPTTLRCEVDPSTPRDAVIYMTQVKLVTGHSIVFLIGLNTPAETPEDNRFMIVLRDYRNVTVDSNPVIPGMPLPPPKFETRARWIVPNIPSLRWFKAWTAAAQQHHVFLNGIARGLKVPNRTVTIQGVEARIATGRRLADTQQSELDFTLGTEALSEQLEYVANFTSRKLDDHIDGEIRVNFSVALLQDPYGRNYGSRLQRLFAENASLGLALTAGITQYVGSAKLQPLNLQFSQVVFPVLRKALNVSDAALLWATTTQGSISRVELRLSFNADTDLVKSVLVVMPPEFSHELHKLTDFRIVRLEGKDEFPVSTEDGSWIDSRKLSSFNIWVEADGIIKTGRYAFDFPVLMPSSVPVANVWYFCLCDSHDCSDPSNTSVLTAFSIPGFNIGDQGNIATIANGGRRMQATGSLALIALSILLTGLCVSSRTARHL